MSDLADTCPTFSNFLSVNQRLEMAFNFYSRRFSASLLTNPKRKLKKSKTKAAKQSQTMRQNNKTKASAFPRRQANTPKFSKKREWGT